MEMMQYKPWEKNEVNSLIEMTKKDLPVLDIQLGGACNFNCMYCDTPKYGSPCSVDLEAIKKLLDSGKFKWVYICGLGEPTVAANIRHLKQILAWCKEKGIGVSTFSNVSNIDDELLDYIDCGTLNVLFKLDTFKRRRMKLLYGKDVGKLMLRNYKRLREVLHAENGVTNLGASIVPSSVNQSELNKIFDYCMKNGIFPLVGQLEKAGLCTRVYDRLKVDDRDLLKYREYISRKYGINYEMPTCPATLAGIHVTNTNEIILESRTGLSCPWFMLDEPQMISIGNIQDMSYDEIVKKVLEYREQKLPDVIEMVEHMGLYPFGGCGGNAKQLLQRHIELSKK